MFICRWLIAILFVFIFLISKSYGEVLAVGLSIDNVVQGSELVKKYEKLEINFAVNSSLENLNPYFPYDPDPPLGLTQNKGISVNAVFTDPTGQTYTQPAFYYQDFENQNKNNKQWLYPKDNFSWKVRFAPNKIGAWQYRIIAQDETGLSQSSSFSFQVIDSANKGFIKVSDRDSRYFEFENGEYFPALGYNADNSTISFLKPEQNKQQIAVLEQNKIELVRLWLSSWSIFGSAWNPWRAVNPIYNNELPDPRLRHDAVLADKFSLPIARLDSEVFLWLSHDERIFGDGKQWNYNPCVVYGWEAPALPLKQNSNYRLKIRYKEQGIAGPKEIGKPFGFVAKTSQWLDLNNCNLSGSGSLLAANYSTTANWRQYQDSDYPDWSILEGNFNSGNKDFMDKLYLVLENTTGGNVFVDYVWIEENLAEGNWGINIIPKPWMAQHKYFDQRNSFVFDQVLDEVAGKDVFFKLVVLEKLDYLLNIFEFDGSSSSFLPHQISNKLFYGNGKELSGKTKVRWLEEAWWRYLQARWGYSTNIHSWELLNEGSNGDTNHWLLANELGKFMHQFEANKHLVTTSFWSGFPYHFWKNTSGDYSELDYADQHLYINQSNPLFNDTALASYDLSMLRGAKFSSGANKPLMRGEIGFIFDNQNLFAQNISQGLWLHNLIWAGLNSGGGIESYWNGPPTNGQIYKSGSHDYRSEYKQFYDFVSDIPLNNGNYQDIGAQVNNANLRVWGQKDLLNNRAHFWVQNRLHTWKNVADGIAIAPINETIKFIGFEVNKNYKVEKWQFSPLIVANESVLSNDQGEIDISIQNLTTDAAFKIGDYLPFDNCRTDKDGNKQINIADFFAAFDSFPVGAGDLVVVMQKWGKSCN